ncbi:hypothetical protein BDY19DRAFT_906699 [Irpex rosettiformis]|uniref:Uncharacterized protein n=1 Tax=Irpex rosettiformis TaxID=378272 RepID=A0ACB8U3B6_9APHY|nr:hypothetical protein BDY19DRAFT_906699 [Irpex rosettiformis]
MYISNVLCIHCNPALTQSDPTMPTHAGKACSPLLFTPHKQRAVEEAVTHLHQTDTTVLTHPAEEITSSDHLPMAILVQVLLTPRKAPLDTSLASCEEVIADNNELRAQLKNMCSALDRERRIVKLFTHNVTQASLERVKQIYQESTSVKEGEEKGKGYPRAVQTASKKVTLWRKAATQRKKDRRIRDLAQYEKARVAAQVRDDRPPARLKALAREHTPECFRALDAEMNGSKENIEDVQMMDSDEDSAGLGQKVQCCLVMSP